MKGTIRRLFCWHDYKQVSNWDTKNVFSGFFESKYPIYIEKSAIFKCEKCGRYKVVRIKT
jgi:hypothetical protein